MTNARITWIVWCCICAVGWLFVGLVIWPLLIFVPLSVLAILIPIGQPPKYQQLPPPPPPRQLP